MSTKPGTDGSEKLVWFKSSYSGPEGDACLEVAVSWLKSSYSGSDDDNCIEVAASWRKSTYSGPDGGDCIEVAVRPHTVHVRDSKNKQGGPQLAFAPASWAAFVAYAAGR